MRRSIAEDWVPAWDEEGVSYNYVIVEDRFEAIAVLAKYLANEDTTKDEWQKLYDYVSWVWERLRKSE